MPDIRSIRTRIVRDVNRTVNGNKIMQLTDWCETKIVNSDGSVVGTFMEPVMQCHAAPPIGSFGAWDLNIAGFTYENFANRATGYRNYD